eukprot:scaffold40403_cov36-Tisochrysis_lutea.AAC.1
MKAEDCDIQFESRRVELKPIQQIESRFPPFAWHQHQHRPPWGLSVPTMLRTQTPAKKEKCTRTPRRGEIGASVACEGVRRAPATPGGELWSLRRSARGASPI